MLANWFHISIVHLAVLGIPFLTYCVFSQRKLPLNAKSWRYTYIGLILLAIITTVAYITGPQTADYVKEVVENYPQTQVEDHALWGRIVLILQVIAGLIGIMGLASVLQDEKPERIIFTLLAILLTANTLIVLYTAHLGGYIRRLDFLQ